MRHQGRFTRPSTDREVDRCNLQDDTVGAVNCGDRISVTEERQGFLHLIFNFESSEAFQSSLRGSNLRSRNQGRIFKEKDLCLVDPCISNKEFRTAHIKPLNPGTVQGLKESTFLETFKQTTVLPGERLQSGTYKTTVHIHINISISGTLQTSVIQGSVLLWIQ